VQLSLHADYALRVLIYVGAHPGRTVTTGEMSGAYGISKNHLVRVVQTLAKHGYVRVALGRAGGVTLGRDAGSIRLGDVIRDAEPDMRLVECFDPATNTCPIAGACLLKQKLREATREFLASLNQHTLGDLLAGRAQAQLAGIFVQIRPRENA